MAWFIFLVSAGLIIFAAIRLAQYSDIIAVRTRLGGMFIGALLLAAATSLPEFFTALNAIRQSVPNLTAGDFFGSCMFNMFLLAVLDAVGRQERILRQVAFTHSLTAALAASMIGLAVFFLLADIPWRIGWIGVDSLLIMLVYIGGIRLVQLQGRRSELPNRPEETRSPKQEKSLWHAVAGFVLAALALVLATPHLVSSSAEIAEITGLGDGFIGVVLVALVTSMPETISVITAVRMGAFDLAVGNLFGSNVFNMFALALVDVFYIQGRFLGVIDPAFALAGLLGLLLTCLGLIGNLARLEKRLLFIELDALLLIVIYFGGLYLLYSRHIGM